jgi:DTW domain-containing protein YfiP
MNIFLLTHQREITKKTNTGVLASHIPGANVSVMLWERTRPNPALLACIEAGTTALLYPSDDSSLVGGAGDFENYIIIDGTWQEARKIYNKSPYLKSLPAVKLSVDRGSAYTLRRNQKEQGLCTAECVIELWKARGFLSLAEQLQSEFELFLEANAASRPLCRSSLGVGLR